MNLPRSAKLLIAAALVLSGVAAILIYSPGASPNLDAVAPPNEYFDASLQARADRVAKEFGDLAPVPVLLTDSGASVDAGELVNGVAYTRCVANEPVIFIREEFYRRANETQLSNIVKHELTHAWFCRQSVQTGHDTRFRDKFASVGGIGN